MSVKNSEVLRFIEAQLPRQQRYFGAGAADRFLSYMGSTREAGTCLAVSAHRLLGIVRGGTPTGVEVQLGGRLPQPLGARDIATVCAWQQYQGYQMKTRMPGLAAAGAPVQSSPDRMLVHAEQVFTLHHGPFTLNAFERVPLDEVLATVGAARFALVGVGAQANLSPRFCFHHAEVDGAIALYHGEGLPMKTFHNVKVNPLVSRVVLDPTTFTGFVAHGVVEEFQPADEPLAYEKLCNGFAAGGWGKPARSFRFLAGAWSRLVPTA